MNNVKFEFHVVASPADPKSNTINITKITLENGESYSFTEANMNISHHVQLKKTKTFGLWKETIRRHDRKSLWFMLIKELEDAYFDEAGNVLFKNTFLDKITEDQKIEGADLNLKGLLEQLTISEKKKSNSKDLKDIAEKVLLEKFTSRTLNVKQWMETFEKECTRFEIVQDEMKIELLRLVLDKSCTDWYQATVSKLGQVNKWNEWKRRILDTFADKGWNSWRYAVAFRYKEGMLIDYAIKKEKLLLEVNKSMDQASLIALIVIGLPKVISDKIDKDEVNDSTKLFKEIRKYENFAAKKNYMSAKDNRMEFKKKISNDKKPCRMCESLNKGERYHAEEKCWFRMRDMGRDKNNNNKIVSNTMLEVDLSTEQKN
uniref:Uncharacterized protein n=1 Tax=Trichogramma kaykai TaxID=54128 RepID=A0ABD2WYG3_9HYME